MAQNYTFRKSDLALFPALRPGVAAPLSFEPPARASAGKAKAAQNFARMLLTPRGTRKSDPSFGTGFVEAFTSGRIFYTEDIPGLFAIHALDAVEKLYEIRPADAPGDEIVVEAALAGVSVSGSSVALRVLLQFEDGQAETIIPVAVERPR